MTHSRTSARRHATVATFMIAFSALALAISAVGAPVLTVNLAQEGAEGVGGRCFVVEPVVIAGTITTPEVQRCVPWPSTAAL